MTAPVTVTVTPPTPITPLVPTATVELPSRGHYYLPNNPLSSGKVELKYPTTKSEDILTSQVLIKKGMAIDRFIQSLLYDTTIDYGSLLSGDQAALLVASRQLAYGSGYPVLIDCPECKAKITQTVDLAALDNKVVKFNPADKGKNELEFTLPFSKISITYKLLTIADIKSIDSELEQMQRKLSQEVTPDVSLRLKRCLISIAGKTDAKVISDFVDTMPTRDALAFRAHVAEINPDVDMQFDFMCTACNYTEKVGVPLGISFLWPIK